MKRKRLCIVATVPFALTIFMRPHILALSEKYDLTLIANGEEVDLESLVNDNIRFIPVKIRREISIFSDIFTLIFLCWTFRKNKFDAVHSLLPKAGLLGMLAAFIARVPHRIHTFTGQVWVNKIGFGRLLLKTLDKIIVGCATDLLTDSFSQKDFLIKEGIVSKEKIHVLGHGSICGVDVNRFKPNPAARKSIRATLGVSDSDILLLYLGRLNRDKGVHDLAAAFCLLADKVTNAHLVVVGPDEDGMAAQLHDVLIKHSRKFHLIGFTNKPEDYMAASDIFCLQSYREGFSVSVVEAGAAGLPTVASRIYGLTDSVADGETGILHEAGNIVEINNALLNLATNENLRMDMAENARRRVGIYFTVDIIRNEMLKFYFNLFS